jgi:hypothetical protein
MILCVKCDCCGVETDEFKSPRGEGDFCLACMKKRELDDLRRARAAAIGRVHELDEKLAAAITTARVV